MIMLSNAFENSGFWFAPENDKVCTKEFSYWITLSGSYITKMTEFLVF